VTGVLVGTVALGAAGGVGLSALQSDAGSAGAARSAATTQAGQDWEAQRQAQSGYTDPVLQSGQDWEAQRATGAAAGTGTQTGPMDAHEAPAFQNPSLSDADQAYADRLSGQAKAAAPAGPMDVHEAPAFQNAGFSDADQAYADRLSGQAAAGATSVDADSDIGIMDASGAAAGTDAEGAPSYVDAARQQALQNQASDDDASPNLKGPAPR